MVVTAALAILASTVWAIHQDVYKYPLDVTVYHGAMNWFWNHDRPLYDFHAGTGLEPLGFVYPPFAAVFLAPLSFFELSPMATTLFTQASLGALALFMWWLVTPLVKRTGWNKVYVWALATAGAFALGPVYRTVELGQINLFLVAFVVADFMLLARGSRWAGIGIGIAAAIKLTPALFVVYLLVTCRWRATIMAAATAASATLVGFLLMPRASWLYFSEYMSDTTRLSIGQRINNQSLAGLVARVNDTPQASQLAWLALAVPVALFALWRAQRAQRSGAELTGFSIVGLATCLVSPISWVHHLVWVVPALIVVVIAAVHATHLFHRLMWATVALGTFVLFSTRLEAYGDYPPFPAWTAERWIGTNAFLIGMILLILFLPSTPDSTPDHGTALAARSSDTPRHSTVGPLKRDELRENRTRFWFSRSITADVAAICSRSLHVHWTNLRIRRAAPAPHGHHTEDSRT